MVEIARALSFGARFIVLDEPTAQLDNREIERLFAGCARSRSRCHLPVRLATTSRRCTRCAETVTVLRDARWITTAPVAELPRTALVEAMAGESIAERTVAHQSVRHGRPVLLDARGLTSDASRTSTSPSAAGRYSALARLQRQRQDRACRVVRRTAHPDRRHGSTRR